MTEQVEWLEARAGAFATPFPAMAERHRKAIQALNRAMADRQPLAVLTGEGRLETDHVLRRFLKSLDPEVTAVFVNQGYADALEGLRAITYALGFDPAGLSVSDLHGVLRLFLENQRSHERRTVLAIERIAEQGDWLFDLVAGLADDETEHGYGLTIVIAGNPQSLAERFQSAASPELQRDVRRCLVELKRFTPAETAKFVRDRLRAAGVGDVAQLFELDAIARLHVVTAGVPDEVAELCRRCLVMARNEDIGRIGERDVDAAAEYIELELETEPEPEQAEPVYPTFDEDPSAESTLSEEMPAGNVLRHRLVVKLDGNRLKERMIESGSIVLGRADTSDVCLPSRFVSRAHALISATPYGHEIRDLGSRNGTFVGSERVTRRILEPDDVIRIGHFLIEYKAIAGQGDDEEAGEPIPARSNG